MDKISTINESNFVMPTGLGGTGVIARIESDVGGVTNEKNSQVYIKQPER